MPAHRLVGAELDFHGHRYLIEQEHVQWPYVPGSKREQFLVEYEPRLRADFLHAICTRFPASEQKAVQLKDEIKTLEQAIDAILWAREEMWELHAVTAGPSQHLHGTCLRLLREFVDEYLLNVDVNDLMLGHHADLEPYWPHVLVGDAENMAQLLEPERDRFENLDQNEMIEKVKAGDVPAPFIAALDAYCDRFGLVPPKELDTSAPDVRWATHHILRLIRNAFRGGRRIAEMSQEAYKRRKEIVTRIHNMLVAQPDALSRFERLHDWALFWGPALNHRARANVTGRFLLKLFRKMCSLLQEARLVDDVDDVGYFTVDDLQVIAVTGDIVAARCVLENRKLEYEGYDRLDAPAFLGKPPEERFSTEIPAGEHSVEAKPELGTVIEGKPGGPGRSQGIVRRIETMAEGDEAGEEDVVVIVKPIQSKTHEVPFLFSLMLRVRGLVVPDDPMMWMHHVGQIARECQVPIVRISHCDLKHITDGCQIDLDGSRGTVTFLDPV